MTNVDWVRILQFISASYRALFFDSILNEYKQFAQ
jgi:hypothetical protein